MSAAASLLDRPVGVEQLARVFTSPVALSVLSADTAAEGTVLTEMADSEDGRGGVTGSEIIETAPPEETPDETREETDA